MIVRGSLREIPEENRIIVRQQIERIHDIANLLLQHSKKNKIIDNETISNELISSVIEEILTEKRIRFRAYLDISIEGDIYGKDVYGLFAKINLIDFKRALSNIINNAVEALVENKGSVLISLRKQSNRILKIEIKDTGRGIPKEFLNHLLKKEISFGKNDSLDSGTGLGLFHANNIIKKFEGDLEIESEVGKGTTIIITLPCGEAPSWFVSKIEMIKGQKIVVLDDDQGIHQTWEKRFKEFITNSHTDIVHLSNPKDFDNWVEINSSIVKSGKVIFLNDFELIGSKETGLDLIEKHKLENAMLVTSHYENFVIKKRCLNMGVRLIPKMLAGYVPIVFLD
jgi:hypothetical protein